MLEVNHSKIKEANRKKIISLLLQREEITKLDISRILNISITTVSTNITELKGEGFVEEVRSLQSTGGRKAISFKINENSKYSIGVAVTPRHVKLSLVNLRKQVVDSIKIRYSEEGIENIVSLMKENINIIMEKNNVSSDKLLGVGISIPSIVEFNTGTIKNCYLLGVKEFNMKDEFSYLGVPIYLDNEANLSAYYEFLNKRSESNNILYISITDGLGLGIIIDGRVYRGDNNASGEMGHMKVVIDGKECKCGAKGCLEAYTSKAALLDEYNKLSGSNLKEIDELEQRYIREDKYAVEVINNYINILSVGISNLIMILDPNSVILGGDINDLLSSKLDSIRESVYKNNLFINEKNCSISVANFKESYLLGAAMMPIEEFLEIN